MKAELRIRIRSRIRMFLGLLEPDPEQLVGMMNGSVTVSGSFYHEAKKVRKTLIHTVLWLLYDFLSLKNYVNVASKSNKQKKLRTKNDFELSSWRSLTKIPGSVSQRCGSADPDPYQNVTDPQDCMKAYLSVPSASTAEAAVLSSISLRKTGTLASMSLL